MRWNWQQADWPDFRWDPAALRKAEDAFLVGSGVTSGAMAHLASEERERFSVEAVCTEAVTTSAIEGETLDRASVRSSLRAELGLDVASAAAGPAERGIAAMMGDLVRSFASPLASETLCGWHRSLFQGRDNLAAVGRYRTGEAPMQIVSGPVHSRRVHFEAPPSAEIDAHMETFLRWFNRSAPDGAGPLPSLTRAGISHLYFESVHPFEDGNGRIGRAVAEKAMAQGLGRPTLTLLAETILRRRKAYYDALASASRHNEVTTWLRWFAGIAIEAQRRTTARIQFLIDKTGLLDEVRGRLNTRQRKALLRVLREGPDGFSGGLSARNYRTITGASPATASRDLAGLVDRGALTRTGQRRYTRYHLSIPTRPVQPVKIDARGNLL